MDEGNGVTITIREIYESVNNMTKEVTELSGRFDRLESKISDQSEVAYDAKERSHKAINLASDANERALEAEKDAGNALEQLSQLERNRYEEKIKDSQKQKETRNKFYITVASALIPWVFTLIVGIIYIAKNNGF